MGKSFMDGVLDEAYNRIKNNANLMTLCNQQPTTFTQAQSTYALGQRALGSDHFTIADGDTSGRKITVSAQNSVGIGTSGDLNHLAILNTTSEEMMIVTEVDSQYVLSGNYVNVPAFDDEIADPT